MSKLLRERIRKRREEEDDDMMMFVFPTLCLMDSSRGGERRQRHIFGHGEVEVRRLLQGHVKNCKTTFRMEPRIFKAVATYLRRTRQVHDTRIMVEEKLGFFLYMLSHNASYEDMQVRFGHSGDTLHHNLKHFFDKVIPFLSRRFIKAPNPNVVHPQIEGNSKFFPFF